MKPITFLSPNSIPKGLQETIIRIAGAGNYSNIYFKNGQVILMAYPLMRYNEVLPDFLRVHKQHLVNPRHIRAIDKPGPKEAALTMVCGHKVPIARRRIDDVLEKLEV